jgi:hypothetical protein
MRKCEVLSDYVDKLKIKGVKIEQHNVGGMGTDNGKDVLWIRLTYNGAYPNGDGWYGFANPPLNIRGDKVTRAPKKALETMIKEAIKWQP